MTKVITFLSIVLLLSSKSAFTIGLNSIEIFSLTDEKAIKTMPSDSHIQSLASQYLENINGVYTKLNPIPKSGYAVKIPLDPPAAMQGKWLNGFIDQVIVMLPEDEPAFLMVFENDRLMCFTFSGNTDELMSLILTYIKKAGC